MAAGSPSSSKSPTAGPSRRNLLRAGATAALGVAAASVPARAREVTIDELERALAKPLTPKTKALAARALAGVRRGSAARLRTKLTENSEPSFAFAARPAEVRAW